MTRKVATLAAVLWIGLAASTSYADSSGAASSWVATVIAWLTGVQPDENGTIHVFDNGTIHVNDNGVIHME